MSDPDLPSIEPVPDDGVGVATVGTALWALAALACLPGRDALAEAGREWWLWTCIAGFGLGLVGLAFVRRRSRVYREHRAQEAAARADSAAAGTSGESPAAPAES